MISDFSKIYTYVIKNIELKINKKINFYNIC